MKQKEILQLTKTIQVLDGKGSDKLKWAVYRTTKKLEKESESSMEFIEKMKSEKLKTLQQQYNLLMQKSKTKEEGKEAFESWSRKSEYEKELQKFVGSEKYQNFLNSENEEFKPYPIELKEEDLNGLELNNSIFWVLEKITSGLDCIMEKNS